MIGFENIIITIIFSGIGLLLIGLGIYLKKVNNNFKSNGIDTDFEVIDVKTESQYDNDNNKIGEFYLTTFKFKYNDNIIKETIQTRHKFKLGITIKGKYLPNAKLNKISVAGEGFSIPTIVPTFMIYLGLIILFILISILLNISIKIIIPIVLILVLSLIVLVKINNRSKKNK